MLTLAGILFALAFAHLALMFAMVVGRVDVLEQALEKERRRNQCR